jgi:phosphoribosylformylglycinamidine synthase
MGEETPLLAVHDVGAGGLCNAFPELVHDSSRGAVIEIRKCPIGDSRMSPLEIWCNESQERYVLAIEPKNLAAFEEICRRERAIYAVVGEATEEERLVVTDSALGGVRVIDLDMSVLFGNAPRMHRTDSAIIGSADMIKRTAPLPLLEWNINDVAERVLSFPAVASKMFLITIGDRTVTGMVARDQLVGPWQVKFFC